MNTNDITNASLRNSSTVVLSIIFFTATSLFLCEAL